MICLSDYTTTKSKLTIEVGKDTSEDNLPNWIMTHGTYAEIIIIIGTISQLTINILKDTFQDEVKI